MFQSEVKQFYQHVLDWIHLAADDPTRQALLTWILFETRRLPASDAASWLCRLRMYNKMLTAYKTTFLPKGSIPQENPQLTWQLLERAMLQDLLHRSKETRAKDPSWDVCMDAKSL